MAANIKYQFNINKHVSAISTTKSKNGKHKV